jgi:hypothetical protein
MRDEKNIANKVEEVLNSLEGINKAGPGPFFFTRVQARLQRQSRSGWEQVIAFITRPAIALAGVCVILLLNATVLYFRPAPGAALVAASGAATEAGYAEDFGALANNFLYDENTEP